MIQKTNPLLRELKSPNNYFCQNERFTIWSKDSALDSFAATMLVRVKAFADPVKEMLATAGQQLSCETNGLTSNRSNGEEIIRIISARKAEQHDIRRYQTQKVD